MMKSVPDKPKVLIVDDAPISIHHLMEALKNDYTIIAAINGEKALEIASIDPVPDIILLDIKMPGIDGYEVCSRLKSNEKTAKIPVIFVTALDDVDDEYHGFELGGVDYITKPFNQKIVRARVKTHLSLKSKIDLLENLASIDGLTGIPNRRRFDEVLENEWRRAIRTSIFLSLIMIDIDNFKQFNDTYGHADGDKCLRIVAQTLSNIPQRAADFSARYGGEEFVVILPDTETEPAVYVANKIWLNIESLNIPHAASQVADHVTVSLGVAAAIPRQDTSPANLIEAADKCLYEAKKGGRNQVRSYDGLELENEDSRGQGSKD
ncbi:diguanylate cyclase [Thermodesulfobacteriota bacterium]